MSTQLEWVCYLIITVKVEKAIYLKLISLFKINNGRSFILNIAGNEMFLFI